VDFWLGTHRPNWLGLLDVPLFVSHRTLAPRPHVPRSITPWALDSGGFSELSMFGEWRTTLEEYVEAVDLYRVLIGRLQWAAPMDWMCEPFMVEKTGLSVREHQERTVQNYLDLKDRGPFIPVLQGWTLDDYHRCVGLYESAGVDLSAVPLVGVGSVCRRQSDAEIGWIMRSLADLGLKLHGFGVKQGGLERYADVLAQRIRWRGATGRATSRRSLSASTRVARTARCTRSAGIAAFVSAWTGRVWSWPHEDRDEQDLRGPRTAAGGQHGPTPAPPSPRPRR
jgi:hypothetical protein